MDMGNVTSRQGQPSKKWKNIEIREYKFGETLKKTKKYRKNKILGENIAW